MAQAAQRAQSFAENMSWETFVVDFKTQSAVLYQIAILGEAVKRLSSELRSQHPNIPWAAMAGMRDKLIHDYEGVDVERVWLTLQSSIPDLLQAINSLLAED
ncbi:DUF86 domain-containing protein [Nodosilinea sp. LEGE 07088]|uniref:HepT-like ribonuclease domain-containing protein n=1 Tax=Nodosilinea sp. LEGE 07088 TaxID=2777968 RepID=UPI0028BEB185|nr:DUF86 domain-containing protein [Nodosilinea sp. LEGE 07088]